MWMKTILILLTWLLIVNDQLEAQPTIASITVGQGPGYVISNRDNCDTVFSFPSADLYPIGLAFDGVHLYSASYLSHYIYKYSLDGHLVDSIPYPGSTSAAGEMDFDGTHLWVVVEQMQRIYKLDPSNGDSIAAFPLPSTFPFDPDNYGCAYDNGYIWITER